MHNINIYCRCDGGSLLDASGLDMQSINSVTNARKRGGGGGDGGI